MLMRIALIATLTLTGASEPGQNPHPQPPPAPAPAAPAGEPAATIDLMTAEGAGACSAQWRYSDVKIIEVPFTAPPPPPQAAPTAADRNPAAQANTTYDISPRAGEAGFDDSHWPVIEATSLGERRAGGKVCFNWYRINLTMPEKVGDFQTAGTRAVLNVTVDDYAEVWVNGELPRALNQPNPNLITGFNTPNRMTLSNDVKPGEQIQVAIFGINGPISAAPTNYIWFREAKIEFFPKQ